MLSNCERDQEYADAKREVKELRKQLQAATEALDDIRVHVRLDTTSVQWIEQRCEQGLKGSD